MKLSNIKPVDNRLAKSVIHRPKKSLGQNFLINAGILEKIVSVAELGPDDTVLEIGPGTGNLTKLLSEKAGQVIALEKDRWLIEELKKKFRNTNVEISEGDVLKYFDIWKYQSIKEKEYKIVANIPYYITSRLLRMIFEAWPKPKLIVLTVQKEVAKRIAAKPPDMNLLALSVQLYAEPKIVSYVSRGSFSPMPKVNSAIIKLTPHGQLPSTDPAKLFKLIKVGFSGKRKQLVNNLAKNFGMMKGDILKIFEKTGIEPAIRRKTCH